MISARYLLVTTALFLALPVHADSFYVAVRVECSADAVVVSYLGAWNEQGETMMERLGENGIDPWKLVEVTADRITRMDTIKRECELSDGLYVVEIGPSPGNGNIQGRCGAQMSAWAAFYKGDELLLRTEFESDCFDVESPIRTRVLWRAGAKTPEITEVSNDEFYK